MESESNNLPEAVAEQSEPDQPAGAAPAAPVTPAANYLPEPHFPATRFIVAANVLVFIAMAVVSGGEAVQAPSSQMLIEWGANFGPLTLNGEWWRLFSSMFLHIGFVHICFNMAALWNLGQSAEELYGTRRFVNTYFLSGFGGSCMSVLFQPGVNSAGASGAIFGIYGALFAFFFAHRKELGEERYKAGSKSALTFLAVNLVLGLIFGWDNFCHLGGLITGFVCGTFYLPRANKPLSKHPVLGTAFVIAAICGLYKFAETVPFDYDGNYRAKVIARLIDDGREAEAIDLLNKRLAKDPDNATFLYLRGSAMLNTQKFTQAQADFERAAELAPDWKPAVQKRDALRADFAPAKSK